MSKGERTKQAILDAALELFREHGYEATTMRMVAETAGVPLALDYLIRCRDQGLEDAKLQRAIIEYAEEAGDREVLDRELSANPEQIDRLLGVEARHLEGVLELGSERGRRADHEHGGGEPAADDAPGVGGREPAEAVERVRHLGVPLADGSLGWITIATLS